MDFTKYSDKELVKEVNSGYGAAGTASFQMEMTRRSTKKLSSSIKVLDDNIQKQSKIETNLTIAMYVLSGVTVLLMIIQILIAKGIN
jgi:hypothetical protein